MSCGFYVGSFDPCTNGHLDVLTQASRVFSRLVIGIGTHPTKTPMFNFEERTDLIRDSIRGVGATTDLEVISFDGLLVDAAIDVGADAIIRGLRDGTDLDYEMQMAGMNIMMASDLPTVFFPASPASRPITATLVRQIATMRGDVTPFVPRCVAQAIQVKLA